MCLWTLRACARTQNPNKIIEDEGKTACKEKQKSVWAPQSEILKIGKKLAIWIEKLMYIELSFKELILLEFSFL